MLPHVSAWRALPTVPADVAISPRHCRFRSQQYLWWHGEPDGDLSPPCKNGFLSLQPNHFFPIWLIAQPWGKLCQYRGGVMWRWEWVPRGVWEDEHWFLSSFSAAYETTGWAPQLLVRWCLSIYFSTSDSVTLALFRFMVCAALSLKFLLWVPVLLHVPCMVGLWCGEPVSISAGSSQLSETSARLACACVRLPEDVLFLYEMLQLLQVSWETLCALKEPTIKHAPTISSDLVYYLLLYLNSMRQELEESQGQDRFQRIRAFSWQECGPGSCPFMP